MSATLVDSSVLLDVFEDDPEWYEWSSASLRDAESSGPLLIDAAIYAEVSVGFARIEDLEAMVGVALGYPDRSSAINQFRAPKEEHVSLTRWIGFDEPGHAPGGRPAGEASRCSMAK